MLEVVRGQNEASVSRAECDKVSAGDVVWEVPRNVVGHGEELDFIQRALGSQGRVLRWEVNYLVSDKPKENRDYCPLLALNLWLSHYAMERSRPESPGPAPGMSPGESVSKDPAEKP